MRVQRTTDSHTVRKPGSKRHPMGRYKTDGIRLDEREWERGTSTDRGARAQRQEDQNPEKNRRTAATTDQNDDNCFSFKSELRIKMAMRAQKTFTHKVFIQFIKKVFF
jgi:hypothetical protein